MDYQKELLEMRSRYQKKPLKNEALPRPIWLTDKDKLSELYDNRELIFNHGTVYYACVVQANVGLFKRGSLFQTDDLPADVIYSTHEAVEKNPALLRTYAKMLYSYKNADNSDVPSDFLDIADGIRNELSRSSFDFVPFKKNGGSLPLSFRCIMVFRKHLPHGAIECSLLPVLAAPEHCGSIMILPKSYWTKAFKKAWLSNDI